MCTGLGAVDRGAAAVSTATGPDDWSDERIAEALARIRDAVGGVVIGMSGVLDLLLVALLCGGHALVEDVPGVGKTLLARSLAAATGCTFRRVQFTPDVLPSDITGSSVFNQGTAEFEFRAGPVFTQVLLADEINRATPRTQSALLEAMEEGQVTVEGSAMALPQPFLVLATQNPVESEGTFPLPEAQLDRFLLRVAPGYPTLAEELEILARFEADDPLERLTAATGPAEILALRRRRGQVLVSDPVRGYLLEVVRSTRDDPRVSLGASPRAALSLHRSTQAWALLAGRSYVLPDDVKALAGPVLAHRLTLTPQARLRGESPRGVIDSIVERVAVPVEEDTGPLAGPRRR
jgi:MoxR-like ATPase